MVQPITLASFLELTAPYHLEHLYVLLPQIIQRYQQQLNLAILALIYLSYHPLQSLTLLLQLVQLAQLLTVFYALLLKLLHPHLRTV